MKQVLRRGLKHIVVDEVPSPKVAPHHVLIRPVHSLISSGTETASIHTGNLMREVADNPSHLRTIWDAATTHGPVRTFDEVRAKFEDYAVLGYAGAGIVAEVHPTVTDLSVGDRVAYGGEGTGHAQVITTGRWLTARVPEGLDLSDASFATLGSIALNAVRTAEIGLGESVVVIGLGLVGQLVSQLAQRQGGRVIGTDLQPNRVALAKQCGIEEGMVGGDGFTEQVLAATDGHGADCVIVAAAAKSDGPCRQALSVCRDRGRIVVVGAVDMHFPWLEMYLKDIQLYMSRAYGPGSYDPAYERQGIDYPRSYVRWTENRNMEEFLRLVARKDIRVSPLVTHHFPLDRADQAYSTIMDPASGSLAVVLDYPEPPAHQKDDTPHRVEVGTKSAAPSGKALQVALIGAANIARWAHMPALRRVGDLELRAVHSSSGARGKSYARRFRAAYCTTDYAQIIADDTVDAVLITSRNQHHARQALSALDAGKHVFVEKPMALTEEECQELLDAERRTGRVLAVGFNRRFAPDYLALKRALGKRSGPAMLTCRVNSPGISGGFWMADPAIGGAILGEAVHFIDLFAWLLDEEYVAVSAYSLPTGKSAPIGENNIVASFQFADGSIANLTYGTVGHARGGGERVEAFAPGVSAGTEDFKRFWQVGGKPNRARWIADKGYVPQMRAFLAAMRGEAGDIARGPDGARGTRVCLAMSASAAAGGTTVAVSDSQSG